MSEYRKNYYLKNRESLLEKGRIYKQQNKEKIKEYNFKIHQEKAKESITCDICNRSVKLINFHLHKLSKIHQRNCQVADASNK